MRRSLIALATAATLAVSAATPARADGGATAAWIIGGIAVAGLIAAATYPGPAYAYGPGPAYYSPYYTYVPGPRCYWRTVWGPWGPYQARVCY